MNSANPHRPNFDHIARAYRWMEYMTHGRVLERIRYHHLPALQHCRRALILGDGDGRFTARLMASYPGMRTDVVDTSAAMLTLLRERVGANDRLSIAHEDVRAFKPAGDTDLVVAHFFFDCFTEGELADLIFRLMAQVAPNALWLVSDFRIPNGLLHWPARLYIRMLYLAFRLLTGLRIIRLPDIAAVLRTAGLIQIVGRRSLFGLLTSEIWRRA